MVPMNLLRGAGAADYVVTGSWGKKALASARLEGDARVAWDGADDGYVRLPEPEQLQRSPRARYVHVTSNETIEGVQFPREIDTGGIPLVCDASSDFLSRPVDIDRYGLIYACAQKNAGPAGVTMVLVREELLDEAPGDLPEMLDFRQHIQNGSMLNTPPVFAIYMVMLVTEWLIEEIGGLEAMARHNEHKAALLYAVIDGSDGFYRGHARPDCRSRMNVTFRLPSSDLESAFLSEAASRGLSSLAGHRSVGGIRASIYNAMPTGGVEALAAFMAEFATTRRVAATK
jgi:phosphoserine aminotransferase